MEFIAYLQLNSYFYWLLVGVCSIVIGSFLNVLIYRLPLMLKHAWTEECRLFLGLTSQPTQKKLGLSLPLSHCPHCKTRIKARHNVPVLSFLWLKGRCAYCGVNISWRYPLVEVLTCILSLWVAIHFGVSLQALAGFFVTWILVGLTFIDIDHQLLPDELTLLLVWLGLFCSLFSIFCTPSSAIIGAMLGYSCFALIQGVFYLLTKKTGMGQGDFKLLAGIGALLGYTALPFVILAASLLGIVVTGIQMLIKKKWRKEPLPFGPYLAVAGYIAMLFGDFIVQSYLQLI